MEGLLIAVALVTITFLLVLLLIRRSTAGWVYRQSSSVAERWLFSNGGPVHALREVTASPIAICGVPRQPDVTAIPEWKVDRDSIVGTECPVCFAPVPDDVGRES